jgi:hypothetical protein
VSLLKIRVRPETSVFQIKVVNSRRLRAGGGKGFRKKVDSGAATDYNVIT